MIHRPKRRRPRKGVTSVEFALVCPAIFLIAFGMIELSRAQSITGTARTSLFVGAREASVANSNAGRVRAEMEDVLSALGISDRTITVTPESFDSASEVTIQIEVPFSVSNGLIFQRHLGGSAANFSATISR